MFARFGADFHAQSVLSNKILRRSSVGSLSRVRCLVGQVFNSAKFASSRSKREGEEQDRISSTFRPRCSRAKTGREEGIKKHTFFPLPPFSSSFERQVLPAILFFMMKRGGGEEEEEVLLHYNLGN